MNLVRIEDAQKLICEELGIVCLVPRTESKTGFAVTTRGNLPINGLRHPPTEATSGWFIWCGEQFSEEPDFFASLHTYHLYEDYPEIAKLLGLSPGYRFLLSGDYRDIWFDPKLLDMD